MEESAHPVTNTPAVTFELPSAQKIRREYVEGAVQFLSNPEVRVSSDAKKTSFLKSKGTCCNRALVIT